jgi:predicted nuclease with TOPRIM domain
MRLSRKDKQALKRALWGQIDNILSNVEVKSGYGADLEHLPVEVIREYLEAVIYGRKGSI